ncbi:hypothetical protein [Pseudoxanthomonas sp. UC19_8]|uniref:hypothetical protein n=1 Tax=Pseudoxanthomonas sp. UC19_8 TaxID=3350175 RepID=UPI0036D29BB7
MLGFAKFALKSDGIGEPGPVDVTGTQAHTGITSLSIHAFGKSFVLNPSQLSQLKGFWVNGVQTTYADGDPELGGSAVYLVLSAGFTSGVVKRKFVVITESGSAKVTDKLY